jgi:hypothetical protein
MSSSSGHAVRAPLAAMLARRGLKVTLVERAAFLRDTLSART